jgi:Flp pilus assembly protein TadD
MARAWDQLGRGDRAMEESSTAVHIDPDHPVALNNLGARLARAGRVEEAEKMFRRAVEVSPGYAPALRNAAMAAAQRGDGPEARSLLERARRADPEAPGLDDLAERVRALP